MTDVPKRERYNDLEAINGAIANNLMDEVEKLELSNLELAQMLKEGHELFGALRDADAMRTVTEEVGWNRYRLLIKELNTMQGGEVVATDLKLLVRFASATHQYLRREKEIDYVIAAFNELPLGPNGIHF